MTALINPRLRAALRNGSALALLAEIDHPDGTVRAWSHTGTLRYGGYEWQGLGTLGKVTASARSSDLAIKQVTFELSGVPPTSTTFLSSRVRNREASVWFAATDRRRLVSPPELIIWAKLDYQKLKIEENGLAKIQITGNVGFWNIERATNKTWTHEEQIADYPGDVGLSLLPELVEKESNWRLTA